MPVYFAQAVDGGAIKIGHSVDVPSRIKQLESHYGRRLAVLATLPGGRPEEQAIHGRFDHLRFGRSEQFQPAPDLLAFIGRPLFVNATPVTEPMEDFGKCMAVQIRGSREWKAWLEGMAESEGDSVAKFCERLAKAFAKETGYPPPPRR